MAEKKEWKDTMKDITEALKVIGAQAFKRALLFLFFPILICSYFSLLFHENALLSLLFHCKMSFMRKNPKNFPHSLRLLGFYMLMYFFIEYAAIS